MTTNSHPGTVRRVRRLRALRRLAALTLDRPRNLFPPWWHCPICGWHGPFIPFRGRPWAQCPGCDSLERHRLQYLVLTRIWPSGGVGLTLHVAPEPGIADLLRVGSRRYVTIDPHAPGVDLRADLCNLPFDDGLADLVYASHVLEHILNDRGALAEIHRVLKPRGFAILPVPIVAEHTLEFSEPRADESGHVRAPGLDYWERFRAAGFRVEIYTSSDFPDARLQLRPRAPGAPWGGDDRVPICRKQ